MAQNRQMSFSAAGIKMAAPNSKDLFSILADGLSIIGTAFTLFELSKRVSGPSSGTLFVDLEATPFAIRLVLLVLVSGALGWGLGSASVRMTRAKKEYWHVISYLMAVVWAGVLVAAAQGFADTNNPGLLPQFTLFTFLGLGIVLWLASFQYRAHARFDGLPAVNRRAIGLLITASTTVVVMLLTELT